MPAIDQQSVCITVLYWQTCQAMPKHKKEKENVLGFPFDLVLHDTESYQHACIQLAQVRTSHPGKSTIKKAPSLSGKVNNHWWKNLRGNFLRQWMLMCDNIECGGTEYKHYMDDNVKVDKL